MCIPLLFLVACTPSRGDISMAELKPAQAPYEEAMLVVAGTRLPVRMVAETKGPEVVFFLRSKHGETLEHEAYKFDDSHFSLWRAGGELYDPVLPLLNASMKPGDSWSWSGTMVSAVDGKPSDEPHAKAEATAQVKVSSDKLNLRMGAGESIRVDVQLEMKSGGPTPAQRKLSFWFLRDRGMIKREFAASSTRLPADEDAP